MKKYSEMNSDEYNKLVLEIANKAAKTIDECLVESLDQSDKATRGSNWLVKGRVLNILFSHHFQLTYDCVSNSLRNKEMELLNETNPKSNQDK